MKTYFGSINFGVDFFLALTIIPPKTLTAVIASFDVVFVDFLLEGMNMISFVEEDTLTYVVVAVVEEESVVVVVVCVVLVVVEVVDGLGFSVIVSISTDSVFPTLSVGEYLFPLRGRGGGVIKMDGRFSLVVPGS